MCARATKNKHRREPAHDEKIPSITEDLVANFPRAITENGCSLQQLYVYLQNKIAACIKFVASYALLKGESSCSDLVMPGTKPGP